MPKFPGFVGGSNTTQSMTLDCERTVNLYVEKAQSEAAANGSALLSTPGFQQWTPASKVADVGGRASLFADGRLFKILGSGFYEFDINGTPTKRGTVLADANPAQIVFNGVVGGQLGIVSGGSVYPYDLTTNILAAPVLAGGYTHLCFAAGFGLAFNPITGMVRVSDPEDFTVWSASTFFRRSLFADPAQAIFVDSNNLVFIIGTDTFEVRYASSGGDQPFQPLSGLVGRYGIVAPFAFGLSATGNFWLAKNPEGVGPFVVTRGSSPTPLSNAGFATAVARYLRTATIGNSEVMVYQQENHTFATVFFPSVPATWTVDITGESWAERGRYNVNRGDYDLWAPRSHCVAFGKHLITDRTTGMVSVMDTNLATEIDGTGIRRLRRAPFPSSEHKRIPIDQFELVADTGVGLASGQGSDPKVMARFSNDYGRTWGNERQSSLGRIGKFGTRCYWTRLGSLSAGAVEITYSDPTPLRIVDALVNNAEQTAA